MWNRFEILAIDCRPLLRVFWAWKRTRTLLSPLPENVVSAPGLVSIDARILVIMQVSPFFPHFSTLGGARLVENKLQQGHT